MLYFYLYRLTWDCLTTRTENYTLPWLSSMIHNTRRVDEGIGSHGKCLFETSLRDLIIERISCSEGTRRPRRSHCCSCLFIKSWTGDVDLHVAIFSSPWHLASLDPSTSATTTHYRFASRLIHTSSIQSSITSSEHSIFIMFWSKKSEDESFEMTVNALPPAEAPPEMTEQKHQESPTCTQPLCLISSLFVCLVVAIITVFVVKVATIHPDYRSLNYNLVDMYQGETFFDNFDFFTG